MPSLLTAATAPGAPPPETTPAGPPQAAPPPGPPPSSTPAGTPPQAAAAHPPEAAPPEAAGAASPAEPAEGRRVGRTRGHVEARRAEGGGVPHAGAGGPRRRVEDLGVRARVEEGARELV